MGSGTTADNNLGHHHIGEFSPFISLFPSHHSHHYLANIIIHIKIRPHTRHKSLLAGRKTNALQTRYHHKALLELAHCAQFQNEQDNQLIVVFQLIQSPFQLTSISLRQLYSHSVRHHF